MLEFLTLVAIGWFVFHYLGKRRKPKNVDRTETSRLETSLERNCSESALDDFNLNGQSNSHFDDLGEFIESEEDIEEDDIIWLPKSKSVTVAGWEIDGMVYISHYSAKRHLYGSTKATIYTRLPVARTKVDLAGEDLYYFPSYSHISPRARATYLNWLVSGRNEQSYSVGYVFLYFYGLEHRFFDEETSIEERKEILEEVSRLLRCYGHNGSVRNYLQRMIEVGDMIFSGIATKPLLSCQGYNFPLSVALGLGRLVGQGKAITSEWALSWLVCHPERRLRTPAKRCESEFQSLFQRLFKQKYPEGMVVKPPRKQLEVIYYAASGEFSRRLVVGDKNGVSLPDVTDLKAPLKSLQEIADEAMTQLDKLSRFLARNPEGRKSVEAFALLPKVLRRDFHTEEIEELEKWARNIVEQGGIELASLLERLEGKRPVKMTRRMLIGAADTLVQVGYGLAPDPRFAFRTPKLHETVILFQIDIEEELAQKPTESYQNAILELGIGAFVAHADGAVSLDERTALLSSIENNANLTNYERTRLRANLQWLLQLPPDVSLFRKRLQEASDDLKSIVRRMIVSIAHSDGIIHRDEISKIEKLYKIMGFDPSETYSDLHAGAFVDEPISVRPATRGLKGEKIPVVIEQSDQIVLDRATIAKLYQENSKVKEVLGEVFGEDIANDSEESEKEEEYDSVFEKLNKKYVPLVLELVEKENWNDEEVEFLASRHGVIWRGSVEEINDWSYIQLGDLLIIEYDGYEINEESVKSFKIQLQE